MEENMKRCITGIFVMVLAVASAFAGGGSNRGSSAAAGGPLSGEIRFSWWGNEVRNAPTMEAMKLYASLHPGVSVLGEPGNIDGYQEKLMAQIAAGTAPDIFTMSAEWLPIIAETGALHDLTGKIDLSNHSAQIVEACSLNNKVLGVNVSLNANVVEYNKTMADELGIKMPTGKYTWDDLMRICAEVYQKSGGTTYGMVDLRMIRGIETFIPAFGITHDGKEPPYPWTDTEIFITAKDVENFMAYFSNQPKGAIMPPEESSQVEFFVNQPAATRKVFFNFEYSGGFAGLQAQTKDEIVMMEWPDDGKSRNGSAVRARPGLIESVFEKSRNKALAIDFLDWFANSKEAALILKTARGVLPSSVQREAVLANPAALSDVDKKIFDITNQIYNGRVNTFYAGPPGLSDLFDVSYMCAVGAEVAFGRITPAEAGRRYEELRKDLVER
jgi:ABC-type glycerol-3-phosphate transport system substrate-binding protein